MASLVVLAIVAETVLRLLNPESLDWRIAAPHRTRVETLAANFDGYFRDTRVRTNQFGHRVPTTRAKPYELAKPSGVRRVLVFGDSFAFGDEWPAEDGFVEVLQQRLDPGLKRIQVLNFGVPGYGPFQEADYVRESALAFDPDALVVQFTDVNDLIPLIAPSSAPPRSLDHWAVAVKAWCRRHLYLYSAATDLWYHGRDARVAKAFWGHVSHGSAPSSPPRLEDFRRRLHDGAVEYYRARLTVVKRREEGWRQADAAYRDIAAFATNHRIPLVIIVLVPSWDYECRAWRCRGARALWAEPLGSGREFYARLTAWLGTFSPHYISMDSVFAPYTLEDLADGTGHYGPKKNALVAERLEELLRKAGVI